MSELKAGVGLSRKWDAREAGREVAETALEKLDGEKPKFFLLFSTIHYEKYGGFQELLNGVWEVLPEGTPLIGGTVAGFMNNYGCFARGVTALTLSHPDMRVRVGLGKGTKRNPTKAAENCIQSMQNETLETKKEQHESLLLLLVSGPLAFKIPGYGYRKVIDSDFISKSVKHTFRLSHYLLQKGLGREDEVFEAFVRKKPHCKMILGTSVDDYKGISNYLFFNKWILKNAVVALSAEIPGTEIDVCTTHGMKKTDIKLKITKISKDGHMIHEINHRPAVSELHDLLGWPENFLSEETMLHRILYYPISVSRFGREVPIVMPAILKESIITPCLIDKRDAFIMTVNGLDLINAVDKSFYILQVKKPAICICSACLTIMQTLGYHLDAVREKIVSHLGNAPFVMFFCAGEGSYSPRRGAVYANMSYNFGLIGH